MAIDKIVFSHSPDNDHSQRKAVATSTARKMNDLGYQTRHKMRQTRFKIVIKDEEEKEDLKVTLYEDFLSLMIIEYPQPNLFAQKLSLIQNTFLKRLVLKSRMKPSFNEFVVMALNVIKASDVAHEWHKILKSPLNDFILNQVIRIH